MNLDSSALLTGIALGALALTLGVAGYRGVSRWLRRRQYGEPLDHGTLLVEYGRRMTSAVDRPALVALLTEDLPRTLGTKRAALLLPDGHQLVDVAGGTLALAVSHAAVRAAASAGEAQRADHGRLRTLIEQGRADLDWTRVWIPLMRGFDLRGLWLLGARGTGDRQRRYAPVDLAWLTAVGRQAAVVLAALHHAEQERWAADEMRALYRQTVTAREDERGRISRDLHDGVLQDLCAVTRDLKAAASQEEDSPAGPDGALLSELAARSGETVQALRTICSDLRPPLLQQDLGAALRALVVELDGRSPAPIHIGLSIEGLDLADETAMAVFRIAQEALHNAMEHANASEIAVRLTQYPDRLRLTVTDDGCGIAEGVDPARFVAQGHFGLAGMRERAAMINGRLDVQTAVDYGTVVVLEVPAAGQHNLA